MVDGFSMVKEMAAKVETMMQHKIDAIKVSTQGKRRRGFVSKV